LKFKVQIQKIKLPVLGAPAFGGDGFLFSILHPKTGEPIHEYFEKFQGLGKIKAGEIIKEINDYLSEKEKDAKSENVGHALDQNIEDSSRDVERPDDKSRSSDSNP
jgi:hypothetical protein